MTTAPFTIICVYWFTPIRFSPLSSNTMISTPIRVRWTPPIPPESDVPPTTMAASVFNSRSCPRVGPAVPSRATASEPARPAIAPESMNA